MSGHTQTAAGTGMEGFPFYAFAPTPAFATCCKRRDVHIVYAEAGLRSQAESRSLARVASLACPRLQVDEHLGSLPLTTVHWQMKTSVQIATELCEHPRTLHRSLRFRPEAFSVVFYAKAYTVKAFFVFLFPCRGFP